MSVPDDETAQIVRLSEAGVHPTLIADYFKRDQRIVFRKLSAHNIRGPWPKIPRRPIDPTLRAQARAILTHRTLDTMTGALQALKTNDQPLDAAQVNLLLQAIIEEREHMEAPNDGV